MLSCHFELISSTEKMRLSSSTFVILICMLFPFRSLSMVLPNMGESEFDQGKRITEAEMVDKIQKWIESIRTNPLPALCYGSEEDFLTPDELFIRTAPCHEQGATKRYFFDGQFVDGKMDGVGTVRFAPDAPEQQRCLIVRQVFDLPPPDIIHGNFEEGVVYGIADLSWSELKLKASSHMSFGMIHGLFKIETTDGTKAMILTAKRNKMEGGCWTIKDDKVYKAEICSGIFKFDNRPDNALLVFSHNLSLITHGSFIQNSSSQLVARDAELQFLNDVYQCDQIVGHKLVGPLYTYDIEKETRSYKYSVHADLCNGTTEVEGSEKVQSFFLDYLDRLDGAMPLDPSPIDYANSIQLLSNIISLDSAAHLYEANLNLYSEEEVMFTYVGSLDGQGKFHGYALLKFLPNKSCLRGICQESELVAMRGTFNHGLLQGLVTLTSKEESLITFMSVKDSIVHGMVITFGILPHYKIPDRSTLAEGTKGFMFENWKQSGLGRLAKFLNGRRMKDQPALVGLLGSPLVTQGYLYGNLGENEKISGDSQAYLYPKAAMALVGTFKDNYMISGQKADIVKATCTENILKLEFSRPQGPTFKYNPPSNETLGDLPLVQDPYEAATVALQNSSVPFAGHGIFAIRDVQPGEILAFYNGFHYAGEQKKISEELCINQTKGETELEKQRKCHKYRIGTHTGELLNIPPEWDDIDRYNATLAQKVNNKFDPFTNAQFGYMEHPRFGNIVTVVAHKHIQAGEEVFLNYGYDINNQWIGLLSPWYVEQHKKTLEYLEKQSRGEDVSNLAIP